MGVTVSPDAAGCKRCLGLATNCGDVCRQSDLIKLVIATICDQINRISAHSSSLKASPYMIPCT